MNSQVQPVDCSYFLTAYFWASTLIVLAMAFYTAWTMDKRRP